MSIKQFIRQRNINKILNIIEIDSGTRFKSSHCLRISSELRAEIRETIPPNTRIFINLFCIPDYVKTISKDNLVLTKVKTIQGTNISVPTTQV